MEGKYKLSADMEKTTHLPVPLIVFWIVFALGVIIFMVFVYTKIREDSDSFLDTLPLLIICCILLLFPIWLFCWIYNTMKSSRSMKKHLENWTIIEKKTEITCFSYYYSSDRDFGTEEWYYIIATDWINSYRSKLFQRVRLSWSYFRISVDRDYCQKNWIPYSPRDPKYDGDFTMKRIREIDQQIDSLKEQSKDMGFFAKIKNNSKISKLNDEKGKLFPPSLICNGRNLYLWDEVTVLVNPDNPKNYEMRI